MSKHTPEPWRVLDGGCDGGIAIVQISHITRDVWEIPRCAEDLHRIVACVNACEGMDDPAAEIERLRARVAEYKLAHEGSEAVIHMAIARLGGLVEGLPTHRGNFLQRIDELVAKEVGNE